MSKLIEEQLESLVDQHGVLHVLTGLEFVCREKAEHIRTNWQPNSAGDKAMVLEWISIANAIYKAALAVEKKSVS